MQLTVTDAGATAALKKLQTQVNETTIATIGLQTAMNGLRTASMVGIGALAALVVPTILATSVVRDFDATLRKIGAVGGIEFKDALNDIANMLNRMAVQFGIAGEELAAGFYEFTKAGIPLRDLMSGLFEDTVKLAVLNQTDFAESANIVTQAWTLFGSQMKNSSEMIDMMMGAVSASILDIEDLSSAMQYAGGIFAVTDASFQEFLTTIAALSQVAFRSQQTLRTLIATIITNEDVFERIMGDTGIINEGTINWTKLTEILRTFANNSALTTQKLTELKNAGLEGTRTFNVLSSLIGSADQWPRIFEEVNDSLGIVDDGAESLKYSVDNLSVAFMEFFKAPLRDPTFAVNLSETIAGIIEMLETSGIADDIRTLMMESLAFIKTHAMDFVNLLKNVLNLAKELAPLIFKIANMFIKFMTFVSKLPPELLVIIGLFTIMQKVFPMAMIQQWLLNVRAVTTEMKEQAILQKLILSGALKGSAAQQAAQAYYVSKFAATPQQTTLQTIIAASPEKQAKALEKIYQREYGAPSTQFIMAPAPLGKVGKVTGITPISMGGMTAPAAYVPPLTQNLYNYAAPGGRFTIPKTELWTSIETQPKIWTRTQQEIMAGAAFEQQIAQQAAQRTAVAGAYYPTWTAPGTKGQTYFAPSSSTLYPSMPMPTYGKSAVTSFETGGMNLAQMEKMMTTQPWLKGPWGTGAGQLTIEGMWANEEAMNAQIKAMEGFRESAEEAGKSTVSLKSKIMDLSAQTTNATGQTNLLAFEQAELSQSTEKIGSSASVASTQIATQGKTITQTNVAMQEGTVAAGNMTITQQKLGVTAESSAIGVQAEGVALKKTATDAGSATAALNTLNATQITSSKTALIAEQNYLMESNGMMVVKNQAMQMTIPLQGIVSVNGEIAVTNMTAGASYLTLMRAQNLSSAANVGFVARMKTALISTQALTMAAQLCAQVGLFALMSGLMTFVSSSNSITRAISLVAVALGGLVFVLGMLQAVSTPWLVAGTIAAVAAMAFSMKAMQDEQKKAMEEQMRQAELSSGGYGTEPTWMSENYQVPSYAASGGFVKEKGLAYIHEGELIISKPLVAKVMKKRREEFEDVLMVNKEKRNISESFNDYINKTMQNVLTKQIETVFSKNINVENITNIARKNIETENDITKRIENYASKTRENQNITLINEIILSKSAISELIKNKNIENESISTVNKITNAIQRNVETKNNLTKQTEDYVTKTRENKNITILNEIVISKSTVDELIKNRNIENEKISAINKYTKNHTTNSVKNIVQTMATGGIITSEGLGYIHEGELIIPKPVIAKIMKKKKEEYDYILQHKNYTEIIENRRAEKEMTEITKQEQENKVVRDNIIRISTFVKKMGLDKEISDLVSVSKSEKVLAEITSEKLIINKKDITELQKNIVQNIYQTNKDINERIDNYMTKNPSGQYINTAGNTFSNQMINMSYPKISSTVVQVPQKTEKKSEQKTYNDYRTVNVYDTNRLELNRLLRAEGMR